MRTLILLLLVTASGVGGGLVVLGPAGHSARAQDSPSFPHVRRAVYQKGKTLFLQRCAVCHGENADGHGVLARTISPPKPRDFRNSEFATVPADSLRRIIVQGGKAVGLNERMPAWGDELTKEEIDATIAFIRSVGRFGHVPTKEEVQHDPWFVD